jgi:hypothetical protein
VLSRQPKHIHSLLAYGLICLAAEKFEESRVFIEAAVAAEPKNALANTILVSLPFNA